MECTQPFVREEALADELTAALNHLALVPANWIEKMLAEIEREELTVDSRVRTELSAVDLEQKKVQTQLSRLVDLYVSGDLDKTDYMTRKAEFVDWKVVLM
jgi:hypothetical protein